MKESVVIKHDNFHWNTNEGKEIVKIIGENGYKIEGKFIDGLDASDYRFKIKWFGILEVFGVSKSISITYDEDSKLYFVSIDKFDKDIEYRKTDLNYESLLDVLKKHI